ncbi:hypothetical protein [Novosphingobium sp. P6W]|uniref:hypothetical protein n=1 Tax=Novosphingobium sp. P6W TaxID=1609758 RepID=UPI0005C2B5D4|nr:hypothetical protein [Novosphingobium sp. P6W]AXB80458.1 hypothetical protein TQ38_028300 [Novosphingobium sp. P6W]KIS31283.1 hypothetical protein TQ38_17345 [Novosphingobium sp. P6W]
MAVDHQQIELNVSEFLFRLTTESLRVRSNEVLRPQTVDELVEHLLTSNEATTSQSQVAVIRDHLATIPSIGDVKLPVAFTSETASCLAKAKRSLSLRLEKPVSDAEAISVLMFEYIAAKKAISLLQKLGVISDGAPH